jgi:hypothetical protein
MRENNLPFSLKGPKTDTAKIYIPVYNQIYTRDKISDVIALSVFSNVLLDCPFGFL